MSESNDIMVSYTLIIVLLIFMSGLICWNKIDRLVVRSESFTAPGLTLTNPPSWFPQNVAKAYNEKDWQTAMYLDMYPIEVDAVYQPGCKGEPKKKYISSEKADKLASAYRFWRI